MQNTSEHTFTMQDAYSTQMEQLNEWKELLKDTVYQDLFKYTMHSNGNPKCNTPTKVIRGVELDNFVKNYIGYRNRGELEKKISDGAYFG
jgi:hypothetical protein